MVFDNIRPVLTSFDGTYIPAEFARREKILRDKSYEKRQAEGNNRKEAKCRRRCRCVGLEGQ